MSERSKWDKKYRESEKGKLNSLKVRKKYQQTHEVEVYVRRLTRKMNKREGFCVICGEEKEVTQFHHISYNPNIFFEICRDCHNIIHNVKNFRVRFCRKKLRSKKNAL